MFSIHTTLVTSLVISTLAGVIIAADMPYDIKAINDFLEQPWPSPISYTIASIPHASYMLHDRKGGTSFYTFDGTLIVTVPRAVESIKEWQLLDKSAPNPQPVSFEIKRYKPSQKAMILSGGTAGIIGFFSYEIFFYDKNGNMLAQLSYDGPIPATKQSLKRYEEVKFYSGKRHLDLSGIIEDRTWLWTHPLTWFNRFKISSK